MFKGLFYLFVSGIIFNPAVFFGGLGGIWAYLKLTQKQLMILCSSYQMYLLFLIFVGFYTYFFRKIYKDDCIHIDWKAMFGSIIKRFLLMVVSFYVGLLLASYFDFSALKPEKDRVSTGASSEYSYIKQITEQATEMQKQYQNMLGAMK